MLLTVAVCCQCLTASRFGGSFAIGGIAVQKLFIIGLAALIANFIFKKNTDEMKAKIGLKIAIVAVMSCMSFTWAQVANDVQEGVQKEKAVKSELKQVAENDAPLQPSEKQANANGVLVTTPKNLPSRLIDEYVELVKTKNYPYVRLFPVKGSRDIDVNLNKGYEEIDTAMLLAPETLTNGQKIADYKNNLKTFEALISQREISYSYKRRLADINGMLDKLDLSPDQKEYALKVFNERWDPVFNLAPDIDKAQRQTNASAKIILDLCESNLGKLSFKDGKIIFNTQQEQTLYQTEVAKIQKAAELKQAAILGILKIQVDKDDYSKKF